MPIRVVYVAQYILAVNWGVQSSVDGATNKHTIAFLSYCARRVLAKAVPCGNSAFLDVFRLMPRDFAN